MRLNLNGNGRRPTICLVAGDISGDQNGGRLARAIRALDPGVRMIGAGGTGMAEAGVDVKIASTHLSLVGLPESLRIIPSLVGLYLHLRKMIAAAHPDLVVLIDNETMSMLLARWLRRQKIPVIYFFPPQVWFWGRWRLRMIVPSARRVLCAFREEAELYRKAGADTIWIGHPLRDALQVTEDPRASLREIGLDPSRPVVALMPGSRRQEISLLVAPMIEAARILKTRNPSLQFAMPLASDSLRGELEQAIARSGLSDVALYRPRSYAVLSQAKVALQCSGTATVEAALLGIPSVITYQCNPLAYFVARSLMKVKYIGMVNILLDEMVQPEFFKSKLDPEELANEVWSLLTDQRRRAWVQSRLSALPEILGPKGVLHRAARSVLELMPRRAYAAIAAKAPAPAREYEYVAEPRSAAAPRS